MKPISFMTANYVARLLGYQMTEGWMQGDEATNRYFKPVETFERRFREIIYDIFELGFQAVDLWTAHLNPAWANAEHITAARRVLSEFEIEVASLAGYFGSSAEEVRASCRLANAIGTRILGGSSGLLTTDRVQLVELLKEYNVVLGVENHPEKTPSELVEKIGDGAGGTIGVTVDTGWFASQGYDAARAIMELDGHIVHMHLKDILEPAKDRIPGTTLKSLGHETCAFGSGVVPLEACVHILQSQEYTGALSIEHEPEEFDPTPDIANSLVTLKSWTVT